MWSLRGSSEGSGRCGWIEIPRLWYHLLSSNRADLTRRTRNKTIPASYRLTVRGDERTAVLRISHDTTAIAAEVRVMRSYTAVRRSKSNALNWSYEATSRSAYTAVLEIGERKRDSLSQRQMPCRPTYPKSSTALLGNQSQSFRSIEIRRPPGALARRFTE